MRWFVGLCLVLGGVVLATNPGSAGVLDASWTAPTTNTDGSPLTDLASYRVYYVTAPTSPCPGSTFVQVASPTTTPPPGQIVSVRLTGLTTGTLYNVAVTAVDTIGNQSACSTVATAAAALELSATPSTLTFGSVTIGSFLEQVFTVQNMRTGPVSGTASVSAPFTIVSGSAFTLAGSGTTEVTVRFTPTALVTSTTNVNFTADGDSISRSVTGIGALTTLALTVSKTGAGSGTVTSNPTGISCGATCSAAFAIGTMVTLTAAPAAGSTFSGWSGSCTGTGACTVTMSAARAVTANFSVKVPITFTDDPLVVQTTAVKAVHIVELRTAIASLRALNGLPTFTWTDLTLTPGTSPLQAVHILELRTALSEVYQGLLMAVPTYTDPTIVAGETVSKAAHVQELRNAVRALP